MTPSDLKDFLAAIVVSVLALGTILPLGWALTKRISRPRSAPTPISPGADPERLERMERAIEAIAVEVERITESQRFMTRLMAEAEAARTPALPARVE